MEGRGSYRTVPNTKGIDPGTVVVIDISWSAGGGAKAHFTRICAARGIWPGIYD